MTSRIGILLWAAFAAAGVGAAIAVATHLETLPAEVAPDPLGESLAAVDRRGQHSKRSTTLPADDVLRGPRTDGGPALVALHPPVTQQVASPTSASQPMDQLVDVVKSFTELLAAERKAQTAKPAPQDPPSAEKLPPPSTAKSSGKPQSPGAKEPHVSATGDNRLTINAAGSEITDVLNLLSEQGGLNILASKSVQGKVSCSLLQGVTVETALDSILRSTGFVWRRQGNFIYVGTPDDFKAQDRAADRLSVRWYRPNYITAKELELLITPLLTEGVGKVKATSPAQKGIGPDSTNTGGDDFAGGELLTVRDYESVLAMIDELVMDLDKRPTQVAIEAMILSVRLDDQNRFGVDFQLLRDKAHVRLASGSPLASLAQVDFSDGGLKFGYLDGNISVFVDALESIGETDIVATPRLMCLNRQRAQILIGAELGYVSTTQTETSSTQNVEFLEVGTQLRLRPYIASDGFVRMEIHPELSTGEVRVTDGLTLPNKETTQVTTNVMVRDGSTVIIGGLIRDELTNSTTQIPLLGSLPWVGPLFRRTDENNERRELLVLITPHIVYEPEMGDLGDKAAREFHHRHLQYADKLSPLGKRYLGRKYFHAAQQAWHAGDQRRALRMINLSIHFDPLRRAALDLRSDIAAGVRAGDHTDVHPGRVGPGLHPLDGEVLAPWVLQELQGPVDPDQLRHPVDPGPGTPTRTYRGPGYNDDVQRTAPGAEPQALHSNGSPRR